MALPPLSEREGRGGLNNIRDRLAANEDVDFGQQLNLAQMQAKVIEMEQENANADPGDLAAYFLNQLI